MTEGYILSVTQLNEYVNTLLRNDVLLGSVSIRGEISGFKKHTSGHVYFSLKDEGALEAWVSAFYAPHRTSPALQGGF